MATEDELRTEVERLTALNKQLYKLLTQRNAETDDALQNLTLIIDNISDAIVVSDARNRIKLVNPAVLRMFGLSPFVVGQPINEHFDASFVALLTAARAPQAPAAQGHLALQDERVGKAVLNAIYADDGTPMGAVAVVRDVTHEQEVDRMKSGFIANVSHELRTPLTSILGFAQIIEKRLAKLLPRIDDPTTAETKQIGQVRTNLQIVVSEGKRLSALVNDVLDIAKMESGTIEWRVEPVSIDEVVQAATAASSSLFDDSVQLQLDLGADVGAIHADRDRLIQVLLNLLSNAAKFTSKGSVTVRTLGTDREVVIEVEDTGVGIAPADLDQVFDKFRQGGGTTLTDKPVGTGLGLPICREIVEGHGGVIDVESQLGEGALFRFTLPRQG